MTPTYKKFNLNSAVENLGEYGNTQKSSQPQIRANTFFSGKTVYSKIQSLSVNIADYSGNTVNFSPLKKSSSVFL